MFLNAFLHRRNVSITFLSYTIIFLNVSILNMLKRIVLCNNFFAFTLRALGASSCFV